MTGENMGICLEDWKVRLEEGREENQVTMRITGRDKLENWIRSSPVRQVCLNFYGWQVLTEDPGETVNRIGRSEFKPVVKELSRRLWRFARQNDDVCINPYIFCGLADYGPGMIHETVKGCSL